MDRQGIHYPHLKRYLIHTPVLSSPIPGRPLLLYVSITDTAVSAQHDDTGKKGAIDLVSQTLLDYETHYTQIEKHCLAVVWATKKLRQTMLSYPVKLLARKDPIKYLFEKPAITGRRSRWQRMLSEFAMTYVTKKARQGQAVADSLANLPEESYEAVRTVILRLP